MSGRGNSLFDILDSWSCFTAPDRLLGPQDYQRDALRMAERLRSKAGLLNYYCDPSHVVDQPIFFDTVRELTKIAEPTSYSGLISLLNKSEISLAAKMI